jgi:hypothetical protein
VAPSTNLLPSIEVLLVNWLPGPLAAALAALPQPVNAEPRVLQDIPEPVTEAVVRVTRIAGAARNFFVDRPIVDVDTFTPNGPDEADTISRVISHVFTSLRGISTPDGTVQSVDVILGPHWLPEANQNLTRYSASYEFHCHG